MPAVTASVTLRISGPLLARVDEVALAAGLSRNAWLVGVVERALEQPLSNVDRPRELAVESPAPAEQPETPDFIRDGGMAAASSYVRPEFRPYPKGGKR